MHIETRNPCMARTISRPRLQLTRCANSGVWPTSGLAAGSYCLRSLPPKSKPLVFRQDAFAKLGLEFPGRVVGEVSSLRMWFLRLLWSVFFALENHPRTELLGSKVTVPLREAFASNERH